MPTHVSWCLEHDKVREHGHVESVVKVKQTQYWQTAEIIWSGKEGAEGKEDGIKISVDVDLELLEEFMPTLVSDLRVDGVHNQTRTVPTP